MKKLLALTPLLLVAPLVAFGAPGDLTEVDNFLDKIVKFMNNTLIPLIFAVAFLMFVWGMFKTFILGGSDEGKQEEGKQLMMYAIAGFVIMISFWGIVNLVANGFGFSNQEKQIDIPNLPTSNS
jgi:Mg2+/citrate symporter